MSELLPAPIRRSRRPVRPPTPAFLLEENLFSSVIAGPGLLASVSAAAVLQTTFPDLRFHGFPVAAACGLLSGWLLVYPVARLILRAIDPARLGRVALLVVLLSLIYATPAALSGEVIGWQLGAVRMYLIAVLLGASGLVWGGYLDCDAATARLIGRD